MIYLKQFREDLLADLHEIRKAYVLDASHLITALIGSILANQGMSNKEFLRDVSIKSITKDENKLRKSEIVTVTKADQNGRQAYAAPSLCIIIPNLYDYLNIIG